MDFSWPMHGAPTHVPTRAWGLLTNSVRELPQSRMGPNWALPSHRPSSSHVEQLCTLVLLSVSTSTVTQRATVGLLFETVRIEHVRRVRDWEGGSGKGGKAVAHGVRGRGRC